MPIPTSPGRSGFGPELSLSYDSGSGNGPFGFGWTLSLPAITRKTDKGLPEYRDADESDVYVLSGADDLVPVLDVHGERFEDSTTVPGYLIHRYRPRIEALFARIERWTDRATGEIHWRSITRDNVTTLYGRTNNSRVFDPSDPTPAHPTRIFTWLVCESYDDKGNAIVYRYTAEDDANIDLSQANERNRVRTANRYLKRIKYGNLTSRLIQADLSQTTWMFEVVFDYGEGHFEELDPDPRRPEAEQHRFVRAAADSDRTWAARPDPFSFHRAGFEVRTYRRCHRVLMFHRFPELGDEPCLVRSTAFDYADLDYSQPVRIEAELTHQGSTRFASFIHSVTQSGFVRDATQATQQRNGAHYVTYLTKSLPPLEFEYSKASLGEEVHELDAESLENLPIGLDGASYQLVDLDGESVSGILTEQANAWFYKPNLGEGHFGPLQMVVAKPSLADLSSGRQQLLDLAGDGQLDLVALAGPTPGFYERTQDEDWDLFRSFRSLPSLHWDDPNLRFVDLNGDGHADILITEQDVFTWYPSLAEAGFAPARHVHQSWDEEHGPRLLLADGTQSIYLADMCGDGLSDLVRIRNGEVCYWPNFGYGRFGAKVTMDNAPWFDNPDQFDQRRIRLADIDGTGAADILYLAGDGARLYFNQSGNRWGEVCRLRHFPPVNNLSSVITADLLGNGTTCLVWSSPLPADARRPLRYIDLMGGVKPHLLIKSANNLGAETHIQYASSTKFYLADRRDGRRWITRLPFPVHVVERVVVEDRVSGNRFETRYGYHHGHFDAVEREFHGFGMVEQWDTATFAALDPDGEAPPATNADATSHVPPMLTRTWFHTGVYIGREHVSDFFAGLLDGEDPGEYYREPGLTDAQARALLLDDSVVDDDLTVEEEREACRALKGSMLRQEVYAHDGTDREQHPYTVSEQNYGARRLQRRGANRHAVFLRHARESVIYHYERDPTDARVGHVLTLEVDDYGNVLRSAEIGYGRRKPDLELSAADQERQREILATWTEAGVTNAVDTAQHHRVPLTSESRQYELTGLTLPTERRRFTFEEVFAAGTTATALAYHEEPLGGGVEKRLIEHVRTYYRRDDLGGPLPLGALEALALPFQGHTLALTSKLVELAFARTGDTVDPGTGGYVDSEGDANWWAPSGRFFYSADPAATPAQELVSAREHFFQPRRHRDPFHTATRSTESFVEYDVYDLMIQETRDAMGNRTTVGERDPDPAMPPVRLHHDYRVLQPALVMDPNRNRSVVAFDALGLVAATAVMGKPEDEPVPGDRLGADFLADLTQAQIDALLTDPTGPIAGQLLDDATSRIVYDQTAYWRAGNPASRRPAVAATFSRETHVSDTPPGTAARIQARFAYSDGFGREIQRKVVAEPGPVPARDAAGEVILGADGQPQLTPSDSAPRWVCSGWTVVNNKGKPVRQYEPYFTDTHDFEFDVRVGVSPVFFYDPVERLVATLHPDHSWDKVVYGPWRQDSWDVNDTVLIADPRDDVDVGGLFGRLPESDYLPTWHALRTDPVHSAAASLRWPDPRARSAERRAAEKAAIHASTPSTAHVDTKGRTFLTVARNKAKYSDTPPADPAVEQRHETRTILDIEGNKREVVDSRGRIVERCQFDMLGTCVHRSSMEAGERWMLGDVSGNPLLTWDSRGHRLRTAYDELRRPTDFLLRDGAAAEIVIGRNVYGEGRPDPEASNLRGKMVARLDQAGTVTEDEYDFKGNRLSSRRQLARSYTTTLDWSGVVTLEEEAFVTRLRHDAFNRPTQVIAPHSEQPGARLNVLQPRYNEASLLEALDVWLGRTAEPAGVLDPATADLHAVTDIDYDAKGRRQRIAYGNGAVTTLDYDPLTSRLVHLRTRREAAAFPADCPTPAPAEWPGCLLQSLHYVHDPMGNVTSIRDDAQQAVFFRNRRVEPDADYTYDSVYRLIEATGREHLGQAGGSPIPHSYNDAPRVGVAHPSDGKAVGAYLERYVYDAVANLVSIEHRGSDPVHPGWTRSYIHDEASQIEPAKRSNRLTATSIGAAAESYSTGGDGYDAHGNLLRMSHLQAVAWNFRDELRMTSRQAVNASDADGLQHVGERTWLVYDAAGQRVRKVTQLATGQIMAERIYLDGFEIYRRHGGAPLVRETLHVTDDDQRIAMVETRTEGNDGSPAQLIRFQLGNHLASATVELDHQANVISYAEYTPYGSTAYQAVRSQTEAAARYRHTARERDEETGLYRFGGRYYAPWLGRWMSADPAGIASGVNLYAYCRANPVRYYDPSGADGQEADASNWDRFLGGLKMVGGALETTAGAGLVAVGAATGWTGVGIAVAAAGVLVMAHGADTTVSGARTMWNGRQVDSFTSQGLQAAGMTRTTANLTDAGIGVVGTLGANMATKAPAVVAAVSTRSASVTVSQAAGAPSALGVTNPMGYAIGHTRVGVTLGDSTPTLWSHLRVPEAGRVMSSSNTLVEKGTAMIETGVDLAPKFASTVTIPVTVQQARAAQALINASTGNAGAYGLFVNDCTTYGVRVLNAAGVTASGSTPSTLFVSAALRSPTPAQTLLTAPVVMQPVTAAGVISNVTVGATSLTYTNTSSLPSASSVVPLSSSTSSTAASNGGSGLPDPSSFANFDEFAAAASGSYGQDYLMERWAAVHGWTSSAR